MPDKKTVIIDYGMGNLFSVKRACEHVGLDVVIASDKSAILNAGSVILPGVGAFGNAMENLQKLDLAAPLADVIASGKPFMGICLGFQLLMSESEEFGSAPGLNIIRGSVKKFPVKNSEGAKIPQMGWNSVLKYPGGEWKGTMFEGICETDYMYFVHSFYVQPEDSGIKCSRTVYAGIDYCSSISVGNVFGCQFHPEKSAWTGLKVYANFKKRVGGA
ncbi:MAG: imidazole glycerol phosphate synthase, glutamine amidotransferase subunit [Elusimicrobia bacterium RIFOXYA12_FULL_51_18]|nr:MAG: imidazole glycerol phosphate synthase, glutamine amidotransferase subunit [Elusimicrobia bacterium RIFOXYA12_FULL_51_18]OGS32863.1 MAG: imidazole glycerol phosphate synthase, glutamine amidotransferase subunit [Elusimicrobia bacterium RIFOXYA2_FULL_53_38]